MNRNAAPTATPTANVFAAHGLPLTERPWDHTRATVLGLTPEGTASGLAAWAIMVI